MIYQLPTTTRLLQKVSNTMYDSTKKIKNQANDKNGYTNKKLNTAPSLIINGTINYENQPKV